MYKKSKKQLLGLKSQKTIGRGIFVAYMGKKYEVPKKRSTKKFGRNEVKL